MKNFRTYQLATKLFHQLQTIDWPSAEFKDQVHRASMSIVLNLAEGSGKRTVADRRRFYHTALGSLREVQACLDLLAEDRFKSTTDHLGGSLYRLIQRPGQLPT